MFLSKPAVLCCFWALLFLNACLASSTSNPSIIHTGSATDQKLGIRLNADAAVTYGEDIRSPVSLPTCVRNIADPKQCILAFIHADQWGTGSSAQVYVYNHMCDVMNAGEDPHYSYKDTYEQPQGILVNIAPGSQIALHFPTAGGTVDWSRPNGFEYKYGGDQRVMVNGKSDPGWPKYGLAGTISAGGYDYRLLRMPFRCGPRALKG